MVAATRLNFAHRPNCVGVPERFMVIVDKMPHKHE